MLKQWLGYEKLERDLQEFKDYFTKVTLETEASIISEIGEVNDQVRFLKDEIAEFKEDLVEWRAKVKDMDEMFECMDKCVKTQNTMMNELKGCIAMTRASLPKRARKKKDPQ